jgi:hypothetical protein
MVAKKKNNSAIARKQWRQDKDSKEAELTKQIIREADRTRSHFKKQYQDEVAEISRLQESGDYVAADIVMDMLMSPYLYGGIRKALPKWEICDTNDKNQMIWWVNEQLDLLDLCARDSALPNPNCTDNKSEKLPVEVQQAWRGDLEPLRRKYPDFARFINFPVIKRHRGRPKTTRENSAALESAARDVKRIRQLWQERYGKKNRDDNLAIDIAADRWDVFRDDLLDRIRRKKMP